MMRRLLNLALLIIVLGLPLCLQAQEPEIKKEESRPVSLPENILDVELKSAKGQNFKLSSFRGKVLVIGLWATWLGPSHFQTPALVRLQNEFRSRDVRMVELSTEDPRKSARDVRRWIRVNKVNYRVGWVPREVASTLMGTMKAIPQIIVVRQDGRIVRRFVGFNIERTEIQVREAIEEALTEP